MPALDSDIVVRLADEGVPLRAIARATKIPGGCGRTVCKFSRSGAMAISCRPSTATGPWILSSTPRDRVNKFVILEGDRTARCVYDVTHDKFSPSSPLLCCLLPHGADIRWLVKQTVAQCGNPCRRGSSDVST